MSRFTTKQLTLAAAIAALYVVLSYLSNLLNLAYGPIQLRFSEALTVLPFLFPAAVPGLFIGCLITNILSPYGLVDLVCGSAATLIAALLTAKLPNRWLAPISPILVNGVIIGAMLGWYDAQGFGPAFPALFVFHGLSVAGGQVVACYVLGMMLMTALEKIPALRQLSPRLN